MSKNATRPAIIDVDTADTDDTDGTEIESADTQTRMKQPQTFGQKHALKIMGVVMGGCFITVIAAQVGC